MRACTFASIATLVTITGIFIACGGGQTPPPKSDPGAATTSNAGGGGGSGAGGGDSNPGSTTLAVGPAGSGQKLDPQGGGAPASSAAPAGSGPHKHQSETGRSPDDIRVLVQAHRDEARACYDSALPAHPGIEGDLTMKWTIDPEGNVTDIVLDTQRSTIMEPSIGTCIGDIIKKIKFSRSGKGFETHANYPFNFHPRNTPRVKDAGT